MAKLNKNFFEDERNTAPMRINKFLSDSGVCSRREADRHVENGNVTIDGKPAVMGSKVFLGQKVVFCGKEIERNDKMVLIAFNKPRGIVCTTDKKEPDNIIDFINYSSRIYPIGRLDKDSEGLILLTNNGNIVNKILRAGNNHEKEYIVTVNKPITAAFLSGMASGVPILDTITKPCEIEAIEKNVFRITLKQGLNRQIRRMCEYFEYRVLELQRIRVMNINLGRLKVGGYRNLTDWEIEELSTLLKDSVNSLEETDYDEEFIDCDEFEKGSRKVKDIKNQFGKVSYAVRGNVGKEQKSFDKKKSFNDKKNYNSAKKSNDKKIFDIKISDTKKEFDNKKILDIKKDFNNEKAFGTIKKFNDKKSSNIKKNFDSQKNNETKLKSYLGKKSSIDFAGGKRNGKQAGKNQRTGRSFK